MKKIKHEDRLSHRKWAMARQLVETRDSDKLNVRRAVAVFKGRPRVENIGKNNGPLKQEHAQMSGKPLAFIAPIQSYDRALPRNVGRSNGGAKVLSRAKIIPSHAYSPQPKAPSRRDKHRAQVALAKAA